MVGGRRATQYLHTHTMVQTPRFWGFCKNPLHFTVVQVEGALYAVIGCQQQEKCLLKRRVFHFAHYFFLTFFFGVMIPVRYPSGTH
jgi:hypothetical protein